MANRTVSPGRKLAHRLGLVLVVVGFLSFFSVFVTGAMNAGNFGNFDQQMSSAALRAVGGMFCMIAGGVLAVVGSAGLAGSGVVLDPQQARKDLEPYSRQAGGMIKDLLEEAEVSIGGPGSEVAKIRCRDCGFLNEDDSKFCQECGKAI